MKFYLKINILIVSILLFNLESLASQGNPNRSTVPAPKVRFAALEDQLFSIPFLKHPEERRNTYSGPIASILLPGLAQWTEDQKKSALFYGSIAASGLIMVLDASIKLKAQEKEGMSNPTLSSLNDTGREFLLGAQLYQGAGFLSAYHSFRSAVQSRQDLGEFAFLPRHEEVGELLKAPLDGTMLTRSTTWIPLSLLAGLAIYSRDHEPLKWGSLKSTDLFFSGAFSYNAGVSEEAAFRGWILPDLYNRWGPTWGPTSTALLFGLAHISSENPVPWPQFLMGYYLGYLTIRNNWSLRESIFLHVWWDVIAFYETYLVERGKGNATLVVPLVFTNF